MMSSRQWWQMVSAVAVGICLALAAKYVFVRSFTVLSLFAAGLLLAYILDPVLDRLEKRGLSRAAAVWLVSLLGLVLVGTAGALVVPQLVYQVQDAANNWARYSATAESLYYQWRTSIELYSTKHMPELEVMPFLDEKVTQAGEWLEGHLPNFLRWVSAQLVASLGMVGLGALLALITFHFLMIIDPFRRALREMLPPSTDAEVQRVSTQINEMLGQYLRGVAVVSILMAIVASLLLSLLGMFFGTKYALVLGLVTGLTYIIPYVGPLLSAVGAGFFGYVTASQGAPLVSGLAAVLAMMALNQVFDMLVAPRIVGRRVGLHPLVVLLAMMLGLSLLGVVGMLISTPVAASIKILLARWLPVVEQTEEGTPTLDLDMWAAMQMAGRRILKVQRDLGRAVTGAVNASGEHPAPDSPAEAGAESEKDGPKTA